MFLFAGNPTLTFSSMFIVILFCFVILIHSIYIVSTLVINYFSNFISKFSMSIISISYLFLSIPISHMIFMFNLILFIKPTFSYQVIFYHSLLLILIQSRLLNLLISLVLSIIIVCFILYNQISIYTSFNLLSHSLTCTLLNCRPIIKSIFFLEFKTLLLCNTLLFSLFMSELR